MYMVGASVGATSSIESDLTRETARAQGWRSKWRRLETNESWERMKREWQIDLWERTEEEEDKGRVAAKKREGSKQK